MYRLAAPLAIALTGLAVTAGIFGRDRASLRPADLPPPTPAGPIKTLGVSSCAAMACHHANGPWGSKGSEYSTWAAVDPHAFAYRTLLDERSRRIHERLARSDEGLRRLKGAHDNPLCLRCHTMGERLPPALQADGVGCERCHGPAEHWKNTHYLRDFRRDTPGFIDLRNDLGVRPEVCVKCHVGDAGQEVNHDLIAAGHPRLRFEYAAYFATYPRHWRDEDRKVHGPDVEVRSWLTGQLVSARAALELLAARADEKREAWPEFAEYECAACHHDLTQGRSRPDKGRGRLGLPPWGTWYYAVLPAIRGAVPGKKKAALDALNALDSEMRRRQPPAREVRERARDAARLVAGWLKEEGCAEGQKAGADIRRLMKAVAEVQAAESGWDTGTQVYLGLASLHQAWGDVDPGFKKTSSLRTPLLELRKQLSGSFRGGPQARPKYDTPSGFDPGRFKQRLGELRLHLD